MTEAEALDLFQSDDLIGIGLAADTVRRRLHPDGVVTYLIDRNINYTNLCTEYCSFCAFYRPMASSEGLPAVTRDSLPEDPGDAGSGRDGRPDAGRAAPRPEDRVV